MNWNWYLDVLKNRYAQFEGRAHREEFWMFVLVNFLVTVGLRVVGSILHLHILALVYDLAVLVPSLALGARRLHDTNRTGWWQLIGLVPLLGLIVLIVFFAQEGEPGDNQYGSSPKGKAAPAQAV